MNHPDVQPDHIVGIGASAGGLEAIERFFKHMPDNSGLAFVVVQHLSPAHKSLMAELLSKHTSMPVYRAEPDMPVTANCVYLIPPNKNLRIFHGKLQLSDQHRDDGSINLPIDIFFRSLAEDSGDKAIAIVLSGTGSDGSSGIRAIKENLGMVMAQSEESAAFDGMPRSATATGLVDFVLNPESMPEQLLTYIKHPYSGTDQLSIRLLTNEESLSRIFSLLRDRTKVDFTFYKPSTILRRIERRMAVNQIHNLQDYVQYLERVGSELDNLNRDLLIGVTRFFRDSDVFEALRNQYLPQLIAERDPDSKLRIWVAGCSTGEEAYSLAILCLETMQQLGKEIDIKIFATDVDRDAIITASSGSYAESSVANIEPALLARHFYRQEEGYQISRKVREMVVFAQHNLVRDPPFTKIDLVSCRNLLIYLQPVLQKRVLELFNFSLKENGILLLGNSETTGDMSSYFAPLEPRYRIYSSTGRRAPSDIHTSSPPFRRQHEGFLSASSRGLKSHQVNDEERLLERYLQAAVETYLPFSMIVNDQLELLHVIGDSQNFLRFQSGKLINDVTKLVHPDLAIPLSTGLQKVFKQRTDLSYSNINLKSGDGDCVVNLRMRALPQKKGQSDLVGVFIQPIKSAAPSHSDSEQVYDASKEAQQRISDLETELQFTRENLQAAVEEMETSNEELQATNEELLASNEELQSTNEELQSVNEELYTVNSEYQGKITELTEANNDLDNLFKNIRVATLFIDENLELRRYTPEAAAMFRIMEQDIGRPLNHIRHDFEGIDFGQLAEQVHDTGEAIQQDISSDDGRFFLLRIYPYQIAPQAFTGVVITLLDISQQRSMKADLLERNLLHSSLLATLPDGYLLIDADGIVRESNQAVTELLGYSSAELIGQNVSLLMHDEDAQQHDNHLRNYQPGANSAVIGSSRLVQARHQQGHAVPLVLSVTRIDNDGATLFAGLLHRRPAQADH